MFAYVKKIKLLCLLLLTTAISAWSDDLIMSSGLVPYAVVAKQIAPGTSRVISANVASMACDTCNVSGARTEKGSGEKGDLVNEKVDGSAVRLDFGLISFLWPKSENKEGSENHQGNRFGGGVFLSAHYSFLLEAGFGATAVQWAGPFYIGASYDISAGLYFGKNEENGMDLTLFSDKISGSLNLGGGGMTFMNNHGLGMGMHAGFRQIHILRAEYTENIGNHETELVQRDGFDATDWRFYYGFDFIGYTNLPLLKETKSKGHTGYSISFESGFHLKSEPLMYWAVTWSFFL